MFPIRDHNPSGRTPYVTYALMVANIGIFFAYAALFVDEMAINLLFRDWALIPARLSHGEGYHTLITSMFLHGGFFHLAGNMLFLWIFGDNLEDELGHFRYLFFYLATGVAAGLIHYAAAPGSGIPTVGASGAIAGVMGGYLLMFPKARIDVLLILIVYFRVIVVPAWVMLLLWFGFQFLGGVSSDPNGGGVAYWAHAGGFIAGLIFALPAWIRRGGCQFWARTEGHPDNPEARYRWSKSRIPNVTRK